MADLYADLEAVGGLGNSVLYRMCADYPDHNDVGKVSDKLALIARQYLVARNLGGAYKAIAKRLMDPSLDLDGRLQALEAAGLTRESLPLVIKLHADVDARVIGALHSYRTQGGELREPRSRASFVSKYLHFHAPHAFPILDSLAELAISKWVPRPIEARKQSRYGVFCHRMLQLIDQECGQQLPLRKIDRHLMKQGRVLKACQKLKKLRKSKAR
jgi:hypothetical protein